MSEVFRITGRFKRLPPTNDPGFKVKGSLLAGSWRQEQTVEFVGKGCNHLVIDDPTSACDFVPELTTLRSLFLDSGKVKNDDAVFSNPTIEILHIYRGGRGRPLRVNKLPRLRRLSCQERRTAYESVAGLTELRQLHLTLPPHVTEVAWLRDLPSLWQLSLEGTGQPIDLGGLVDRLPSLLNISLINLSFTSLRWLHPSQGADHVVKLDTQGNPHELDLSELQGLPELREVTLDRAISLEPAQVLSKTMARLVVGNAAELTGASDTRAELVSVEEDEEGYTVHMSVGTPADEHVVTAGYLPSGHFWSALIAHQVRSLFPGLVGRYRDDSESDTLVLLAGDRQVAHQVRELLEDLVTDPDRRATAAARAAGVELTF